jgi:hypothetical protein
MISPSNDPSRDFTIRTSGEDRGEESDVARDEVVPVAVCWWDAQPNTETKAPVSSSVFVCVSFSIAGLAVNVTDPAS